MDIYTLPLYSPPASIQDPRSTSVEQAARRLSRPAHVANDPAEIKKAAQEFEGYFIAYLLKEMRNTVHPALIQNKDGRQFYAFYDQEIGRLAAQADGLGLSRMLEQALALPPVTVNPPST